mgnify:CR=1 FL=1
MKERFSDVNMKNQELIKQLKRFLNEAFYIHSRHQAFIIWRDICQHVPEPYKHRIEMEFQETGCSAGRKQSCSALADEVNKFIRIIE